MVNEIAAAIMKHLCTCSKHGYSQINRWGSLKECSFTVNGKKVTVRQGDRDCSSAVINSWQKALEGTAYEGVLGGATYTGDMKRVFTDSGLFEWKKPSFKASTGDIYLNEVQHTAMCIDGKLGEFSMSETGGIKGKEGDQTGRESSIHAYYDFPWDGILHYNGGADKPVIEVATYNVMVVGRTEWCDTMKDLKDTGGSRDTYAGILGKPISYISCDCKKYRVRSKEGGWLPFVGKRKLTDLVYGAAGDGSQITGLEICDESVYFQVHEKGGKWSKTYDGANGKATTAKPIDAVRIWKK